MRANKSPKVRIVTGGAEEFFERSLEHARRLDRAEELASEIVVSFDDPLHLTRILTTQRIRLLRAACRPTPVTTLAGYLRRNLRAVKHDVDILEEFGLLRTRYETNPAHGRRRIVEPRAAKYELVATIQAGR